MKHKRFRALFLIMALIFVCTPLFSCRKAVKVDDDGDNQEQEQNNTNDEQTPVELGVSVNFIDLGGGESIFVYFPDGKSMLIDCGSGDTSVDKVIKFIQSFKIETVDYLVLTHPDNLHIGGAEKIINTFNIGKIYAPKIFLEVHGGEFPSYETALQLANDKNIPVKYSDFYDYIDGEDYSVVFLSPSKSKGIYTEFNTATSVTGQQINDLSPIIYLEINGVRFMLTGDAGKGQEKLVLEQQGINFYSQWLSSTDINFNLNEVDFLKVSNGGAEEGTSTEFLQLISPRNAVVFVGDGVIPDNTTLKRIQVENEFYKLYRTDVYGNISVKITGENVYQMITDKE